MVVRIRLSRFGCKNKPFYRVMAADSRSKRDGRHLEVLGYYNPLPDPVQKILFRAGLLPPPPMAALTRKGGPRDTRPIDPMSGRYLTPKDPETDLQPEGREGQEGEAAN
ncbi:hypothetical protein B296_00058418 [Ensete ventricosum]|uniref:Ribosomal protein S16 n=1 Tax=Ensete ventricosum TaxID=4639 RepID=A0A426XME6_ENSVE|nr:hypothetical protein B296_00058418 [Ensete ventricosum]